MHSSKSLDQKIARKPRMSREDRKQEDRGRRDRQQARQAKRNWEDN